MLFTISAGSFTSRLHNGKNESCIGLRCNSVFPLDCSECFPNAWVLGSVCGQLHVSVRDEWMYESGLLFNESKM